MPCTAVGAPGAGIGGGFGEYSSGGGTVATRVVNSTFLHRFCRVRDGEAPWTSAAERRGRRPCSGSRRARPEGKSPDPGNGGR